MYKCKLLKTHAYISLFYLVEQKSIIFLKTIKVILKFSRIVTIKLDTYCENFGLLCEKRNYTIGYH